MDRRQFLKGLGIGAAALGVGACKNGETASETAAARAELPEGAKVPVSKDGVSLLGYGCMRWPLVDGEIDQDAVNALVDEAIAHGVNYFDSAPVYHKGKSEEATAKALKRHPRDSYFIATKCSVFRGGEHKFEEGYNMYRRSLEIYDTDHIDYYLLHSVGDYKSFKEKYEDNGLIDYFLKERELGHIRNLGFSCHGTREGFDEMVALHEKYHWDFIQIQMNYHDWRYAERGATAGYMYGVLESKGIPVVIMEPLLGGRLADIPAALADKLKSREPSKSIASWAFRFCGSFPGVLTVLSGMTYPDHLRDNLDTFCNLSKLKEDEMAMLDETALLLSKYPLIGCTACEYCMPCPYGVNIPGLFKFYNDSVNAGTYVVSKEQEDYAKARRKYLMRYDKAVPSLSQAAHCIGCGKCLELCPQHIKIPTELRKIDRYVENLKQEKD